MRDSTQDARYNNNKRRAYRGAPLPRCSRYKSADTSDATPAVSRSFGPDANASRYVFIYARGRENKILFIVPRSSARQRARYKTACRTDSGSGEICERDRGSNSIRIPARENYCNNAETTIIRGWVGGGEAVVGNGAGTIFFRGQRPVTGPGKGRPR